MAEEQARYPKLGKILNLIIKMQSRFSGITLNDIQEELEVSRRSAERLRDVLIWEIPQIEELPTTGREKHWGFSRSSHLREIISFSKDEIAELEGIKNNLQLDSTKDVLNGIVDKLKALSRKNATEIEDAIEILLKTEGAAVTQKPSYKIDIRILDTIRQAIKDNLRIKCKYDSRDKILSPFGIVYGANVYLIGVEGDKPDPYVYRLHKITDIEITNETFDKGDFDIKEYANRSFGVYQNEIIKVELLFSKEVAEDVLNYNFHPTQKVKQNDDGSVTVKFKASGELEILWHIFRWGDKVQIISPKSLKKEYVEYLENVLARQRKEQ
ncbi:MAG: helix-turn-helix transcriptional regulator [Candidatus Gastranaerophilaceae bacterium]